MAEALRVRSDEAQGDRKGGNGEKSSSAVPNVAQTAGTWVTERWGRFRQFLRDVRVEMRQVTWPTRSDVQATTAVVIATVAFFAAYFFVVDFGVGSLVQWVLRHFKK